MVTNNNLHCMIEWPAEKLKAINPTFPAMVKLWKWLADRWRERFRWSNFSFL